MTALEFSTAVVDLPSTCTPRLIVSSLVSALVARGMTISVDGGGDCFDLTDSTDPDAVWEAVDAVEEANLLAKAAGTDNYTFWALILTGNGLDCLCDHNLTAEANEIVAEAMTAALGQCTIPLAELTAEQAREWLMTNDCEQADYWASRPATEDLVGAVATDLKDFGTDEQSTLCFRVSL